MWQSIVNPRSPVWKSHIPMFASQSGWVIVFSLRPSKSTAQT
jgi:hypothetical protein